MNLLIATSRTFSLHHECLLLGVRHLVEMSLETNIQWSLYEVNDEYQYLDSRGRGLRQSNTFHHQTLQPYDGVVIVGPYPWSGEVLAALYAALEKDPKPLWIFAPEIPLRSTGLTDYEIALLRRKETKIFVHDETCRAWLAGYEISSQPSPSPTLFISTEKKIRPTCDIGLIIEYETIAPNPQKAYAELDNLCSTFRTSIIAPHIDDFMLISQRFKDLCRYSYSAFDYLELVSNCKIIIAPNSKWTSLALACDRPAITLDIPPNNTPYISISRSEELTEKINELLNLSLENSIRNWRTTLLKNWRLELNPSSIQKVAA